MKKIISVVLALVMVLSSFAMINVSAATASTVEIVADDTVTLGEKFDVYIAVTEYNGVTSIGFNPVIDTEYLTDSTVAADALLVSPGIQDYDGTVAVFMPANGTMDSYIAAAPGERLVKLSYTPTKVGTTTITVNVSESNATGDSTSTVTKTINITEAGPVEPIVYTGNAIQLSGTMVDGTPALNAEGNMEAAVKAGTGSDSTRIYIITEGAPATMPHMAIGMKLTNANKTGDNFCPMVNSTGGRLWTQSDATGGQNQTFSATEITKHLVDYTKFTGGEAGGWSSYDESDTLIGVAVNAWNGTVEAGTVEVAYVAFFATREEAEAYTGPVAAEIVPDKLIEAKDLGRVSIIGYMGEYDEATGLMTSTATQGISSSNNETAYVWIDLDQTAIGDPAIKYVKIGYEYSKGSLAHKSSDNVNVGMTIGGTSGRFWGINDGQFEAAEGDWLVNLDCTGKGGENISGQYANAVATDTYNYLRFTPWADGQTIPAGTTFSVKYVAFFSDANDAANYVYSAGEEDDTNEPTALVYGKDISFGLNAMYDGADSISYNGNTAVITAGTKITQDVNYDNDDCALITAQNLTIPAASKYLVFGITTDVNNESRPDARPSSTQNVKLFVDGTSVGYADVDLTDHEGTTVYAYAVDASALITSGTNITAVEFDPIPNTNKGATKGNGTRFGTGGSFSVGFIAAFDTLAAAEAYAVAYNEAIVPETETVTVTFMVDGVQYGDVVTLDKGADLVYPEVAPTKDGYTFTGWDVAEGTAINEDTVVNAEFEEDEEVPAVTPVALYTGDAISITGNGGFASVVGTVNEDGNVEADIPTGTGHDNTRLIITTEGAAKTAPYMAIGMRLTNALKSNDVLNPTVDGTKRLWGANSATSGNNQTFSATEITKHIVDFTAFTGGNVSGGWSGVGDSNVLTGTAINAWTADAAISAGTIEVQYVAFFDSYEDAQNYVFVASEEEAETVTVTFMVDGAQYGDVVTLDKGADLVYPEVAPTKDGYTFTGWDVAEGTAINEDTVVNAIFEEDEVPAVNGIVYFGDDLTITRDNARFPSVYSYNTANAAHTYTSNDVGTAHDQNRFQIRFEGVDANKYKYIAVGIGVTDVDGIMTQSDNFNVNMTIDGTQTRMWGGTITIPTAEIGKVIADAKSCSGGDKGLNWSQVVEGDVINGITINPWGQSPAKNIPAGTVVQFQYVALFETLADAEAFVFDIAEATKVDVDYVLDGEVIYTQKYVPGTALVYPTDLEVPAGYEITGWNYDEGFIVEEAITVVATFNEVELPLVTPDVLGKDLTITWNGFYKSASNNPVIEQVGNDTVATGSSNWQNNWTTDRCADFTINNIPVDGKYLILNVAAESTAAKLSTADNILINGTKTLSFDFTAGTQIVIDLSAIDLADVDTITSIRLSPFASNGGQLENVKVVVGAISTAPYAVALTVEGTTELIPADEGAIYVAPKAVASVSGMRFTGWTDGTNVYAEGDRIEITGDLALEATFAEATEWYVTYMVNGVEYAEVTVALDGVIAHPTAPAMEGYKFAGWYDEAGQRVMNGAAVTNDMTLEAAFTEAGDDEELLGTLLTILKMITAKKQEAGTTTGGTTTGGTTGGTTAASSTPVAIYTGEQITVKPQGYFAAAEAAVNAAGNVEVKLPTGTGHDGTRVFVVTEGATTATPYMAIGLKLTNATKTDDVFCPIVNESKRMWGPNSETSGNNQTFSADKIINHALDFTVFTGGEVSGGWSGVTSSDTLSGVAINAWKYDTAISEGTMEIAYVAFFKTLEDAQAYVHGAEAVETPVEEPKEDAQEEAPAVEGAILGKDLEIEWASYWTSANNKAVITTVGDNTVATGDSNWQNDGCSIFTIKNVAIEKGAKTLVLNIKASSTYETTPARPSTANNIVITAGASSKTYSFDFTNATEELTAIELDISSFNTDKLDSIKVDVFANNKVEQAVGNLQGVEVIIGSIYCK